MELKGISQSPIKLDITKIKELQLQDLRDLIKQQKTAGFTTIHDVSISQIIDDIKDASTTQSATIIESRISKYKEKLDIATAVQKLATTKGLLQRDIDRLIDQGTQVGDMTAAIRLVDTFVAGNPQRLVADPQDPNRQLAVPNPRPPNEPDIPKANPDKLEDIVAAIPVNYKQEQLLVLKECENITKNIDTIITDNGITQKLHKDMFDLINSATLLTFLEKPIQNFKMDEDTQISVKFSWILEPVKDELKEVQKLSSTVKLHEIIKKDYDLSKIYIDNNKLSSSKVKELANNLIQYSINNISLVNLQQTNANIFKDIIKLGDVDNFEKLLTVLTTDYPSTGKGKVTFCNICENYLKPLAGVEKSKYPLLEEKIREYSCGKKSPEEIAAEKAAKAARNAGTGQGRPPQPFRPPPPR
jgi:hypothetical protein